LKRGGSPPSSASSHTILLHTTHKRCSSHTLYTNPIPPPRPCDGMYLFLPHHPLCLPHTHTHHTFLLPPAKHSIRPTESLLHTHTRTQIYTYNVGERHGTKKAWDGELAPLRSGTGAGTGGTLPCTNSTLPSGSINQPPESHQPYKLYDPIHHLPVIPYPHHATLGLFTPRASPVVEQTDKTKR